MIKSRELELSTSGIVIEENRNDNEDEIKIETGKSPELSQPTSRIRGYHNEKRQNTRNGEDNNEKIPKFAMIFNKYSSRLIMGPSGKSHNDGKCKEKNGSMYTMIFNKDVTIRPKPDLVKPTPKIDGKKEEMEKRDTNTGGSSVSHSQLSSMKLNDAETLMNLYGRSNLFIPDLTVYSLKPKTSETAKTSSNEKQVESTASEKQKFNNSTLRLYNSLTSLSKSKGNKRGDNLLKNKIASLTSLETHLAREIPRKHVSVMQERKLFRVRSLDLSESLSTSDSDLERSFAFQKRGYDENEVGKESGNERSDNKSRGDSIRKGDKDPGCRKQVQWKSEVDVIYFESHQAADGDRSGEILGRVIEPLREEWEQQRTGFYAKLVPLPLGSHISDRWQSLLKI